MKNADFNRYLDKLKLKGKYSSQLNESQLSEGFFDSVKDTIKKTLDKDREVYRVTGDFDSAGFRSCVLAKCNQLLTSKDEESRKKLESEETLEKIISNLVKEFVEILYNAAKESKGFLYPWIQTDKMYFFFDTVEQAKSFFNNSLLENDLGLNLEEDTIKKMFTVEKCIRNKKIIEKKKKEKGNLYDKKDTTDIWGKNNTEEVLAENGNLQQFADRCAKLVYKPMAKEIKNLKDMAVNGKDIDIATMIWKWTDDDIKKLINDTFKIDHKILKAIEWQDILQNEIKKVTSPDNKMPTGFIYGAGTNKGNIILKFNSYNDAVNFKEQFDDSIETYGELTEPEESTMNDKKLEERKGKGITAKKLIIKIMEFVDEFEHTPDNDIEYIITVAPKYDKIVENADKINDESDLLDINFKSESFTAFNKVFTKINLNEVEKKVKLETDKDSVPPVTTQRTKVNSKNTEVEKLVKSAINSIVNRVEKYMTRVNTKYNKNDYALFKDESNAKKLKYTINCPEQIFNNVFKMFKLLKSEYFDVERAEIKMN